MEELSFEYQKFIGEILCRSKRYRYMLLDRMRQDCDYYFAYAGRSANCLYARDEFLQIEIMKAIHNSFDENEKPEWLTFDRILQYESEMCK